LTKWNPRGLVKWSLVIVAGLLLAQLLEHLTANGTQLVEIGFIILPMPILICWSLELFEDEPRTEEPSDGATTEHRPATSETKQREASGRSDWLLRLGEVSLLVLAAWVVVTHGAR
jgi:hypothetical protein